MVEKVACQTCGKLILPATANKNSGLCMPCKNGYREKIEESKKHYAKERELDKSCPFRALWRELIDKVHNSESGFENLSDEEKQYFSVGLLDGEVYNGGFIQFFDNTSGEYYKYAELGLIRIGARESLRILRCAKEVIFGKDQVPKSQEKRWFYTQSKDMNDTLNSLDEEYCSIQEDVGKLLELFALDSGLVKYA